MSTFSGAVSFDGSSFVKEDELISFALSDDVLIMTGVPVRSKTPFPCGLAESGTGVAVGSTAEVS